MFPSVRGTVIKDLSMWFRLQDQALCSHDCAGSATLEHTFESKPIFNVLWEISKHLIAYPAELGPACHLNKGYELKCIQSHAGQRWTVRNGYSLLILQKIWDTQAGYLLPDLKNRKQNTFAHNSQLIPLLQNIIENRSIKGLNEETAISTRVRLPGDTADDSPETTAGFVCPQTAERLSQDC